VGSYCDLGQVLRDFERVMTVLQHGAAAHYDAGSFVSACAAYAAVLDEAELEEMWQAEMAAMEPRASLERRCAAPFGEGADRLASALTAYERAVLAGRFFRHWQDSTGLEEVRY
jgi:hypothetical protein